MFKAVIFDFDGVVFDTEHKRFQDIKAVLQRYDLSLDESTYPDMLGKKTTEFVKEHFPGLKSEMIEKIAEERRDLQYNELEGDRLIEGIPELLKLVKEIGIRMVVVTGSQRHIVDELLSMYDLLDYFDVIITGEDYSSSKPDPECYRIAVERLGVKPEEAVIIEDAPNGIAAAKRLGCVAFGLKSSMKGDELSAADMVFDNVEDIRKHFESKKI